MRVKFIKGVSEMTDCCSTSCCGGDEPAFAPGETVRDPVCGMTVDPENPDKPWTEYNGEVIRFCNPKCKEKFLAAPGRYLKAIDPLSGAVIHKPTADWMARWQGHRVYFESRSNMELFEANPQAFADRLQPLEAQAAPAGAKWVCACHPEVTSDGPADCPICGMALEPAAGSAPVEDEDHELKDFTRRFIVGALFTVPLLVISMGPMLGLPLPRPFTGNSGHLAQLLLATPVVLYCGAPFFKRAWDSIRSRNYNMWTLIGLGTGAAWGYSAVATLAPGIFPAALRNPDGSMGVYFESAAVIIALDVV